MIQFRYQPTLRDYLAFHRHILGRRLRTLTIIAGCLLALYLAVPFLAQRTEASQNVWGMYLSVSPLLILPALVAFIVVVTSVAARKRWKAAEELRIEREYQIDDVGVRVAGSSFAGFLEWKHFTDAEILKGYFILKTAQNQYHFFPASVVPDTETLSSLLAAKVSNTERKAAARRVWIRWLVWLIIIIAVVAILRWTNPNHP